MTRPALSLTLPIEPRTETNSKGVPFTAIEAYWRVDGAVGSDPIRSTALFGVSLGASRIGGGARFISTDDTWPDPQPPAWFAAAVDEFLAGAR